MKKLTENEIEDIIELAYDTCEKYILKHTTKKDYENIEITINLDPLDNGFDLDINIDLDTDTQLPDDLSQEAINKALVAVDEYIDNRN